MKKILFIAAHRPDRSPSQRFRFEQYFDFLTTQGYTCQLSHIISATDDKHLYAAGHYLHKLLIFIKSILHRSIDILRAHRSDFVFIQREAFMTGTTLFEKLMKSTGTPILFDFDDAIWLKDPHPHQGPLHRLKNPAKTAQIIALADVVIAGNAFLAEYAQRYHPRVVIIPTTIDTEIYQPQQKPKKDPNQVCIGWSGSFSTIKHFETVLPALLQLNEKYPKQLTFKVIGDESYQNQALSIQGVKWTKDHEPQELSTLDIGIMPLPNDNWARGKCGLKGLQYMGMSIPTIMSPVGVNTAIVTDGENGFLASSMSEWVDKLSRLIDHPTLRKRIGQAGRQTVESHYSVKANQDKYLELFESITAPL